MFKNIFFIILVTSLCLKVSGQTKAFKKQLDSIQKLRKLSYKNSLGIDKRILYAEQASKLSYKTKVDFVVLESRYNLAWLYSNSMKYYRESISLNHKNLKLATKLNDSVKIAYINMSLGYVFQGLNKRDSAYYYYYKSLKAFKLLNRNWDFRNQSRVFLNVAVLQIDERDYLSSQANIIKAINILLTIPETENSLDDLWNSYNSLGLNLGHLKNHERALEYYYKALDVSAKMKNSFESQLFTKINIAELYKEMGDYEKAFKVFNELLEDKTLEKKDPSSYAAILNNMAYGMFLNADENHNKIDSLFSKAYKIFSDMDLSYEISASGNDMAEFYYGTNQKEKALLYSTKSYKYGKKANENSEVLRALKTLSKLKEGNEGKAYLYQYIKLNDSLIDVERTSRNKYARIQFETDQYIEETKRLTTQTILISVIGGVLVLTLGLLYFIKIQHTKNKALVYEQAQQEANQEIYALMLKQHEKLEVGRLEERQRISEDLHDGILSKLFGTRINLGFLQLSGDDETLKVYKQLQEELQSIEKEVRDVSHELVENTLAPKTNFETILDNYVKQQSIIHEFKYSIKKDERLLFEIINNTVKVNMFRIIQEALQNIVKHAKAKAVSISFALKEKYLEIIITDDGIGFNTKKKHKGIGLKNIASRVSKIEGILDVESKIDEGTILKIIIPMSK